MTKKMKRIFASSTALAGLLALAGCQEYLVRSDLVSPYSGDAVARNASNQTIDPWPAYVYDTNIRTSSERQAVAIKKYEAGPEGDKANASPAILVPGTSSQSPAN